MADISRLPSTSFPSPSSDNLMSIWIMTISVMKHFFHVPFVANCADSSSTFFGKVHTCQVKPFIIRLAAHKKPVFTEKKNVVDTDFILFHHFADFPWFISRAWRMQLWFQLILINLFSGDIEIFAYFFGPIGILLCVNALLFLSTARQLTCGLWKRDDVKSTTER